MKCKKCNGVVMPSWRYCPFCAAKMDRRLYLAGRAEAAAASSGAAGNGRFRTKSDGRDVHDSALKQEATIIEATGRITDYRGGPVVGARVSLMQVTDIRDGKFSSTNENHWNIPGWDPHCSVITDNDGIFTISMKDSAENRLHKYGLFFQTLWQHQEGEIRGEDILQSPAPLIVDLSAQKSGRVDMGTLTARQGGAIKIKLLDEKSSPIENNVGIYIMEQGKTSADGGLTGGLEKGIYISEAYPGGSYCVKIQKAGYRTFVKNGIVINEGRITGLTVQLIRKI